MIKPSHFYIMFVTLLATNIITFIGFYMSADIDSILNKRTNAINIAYEDRISQLRLEVDRLYSRQYAQTGNLNLQIQELSLQQAALSEIQPYIKSLAIKAQELGIKNIAGSSAPSTVKKSDVYDNFTTGSTNKNATIDQQAYIIQVKQSISQMTNETSLALASMSKVAENSTSIILDELKNIGIKPVLPSFNETASGGPFIPANADYSYQNLVDGANNVVIALDRFKAAQKAIDLSPVYVPLKHGYRVSSKYGNRSDPFSRKAAFHSGTDMAAPHGSSVYSAGDGVVIFSGRNGGYGKVVKIKHAGGLISFYAHLSSYSVVKGQKVKAGSIIAKVGSSGRSTGPHLHFEVRNANGTINSTRLIKAGYKLAQFR